MESHWLVGNCGVRPSSVARGISVLVGVVGLVALLAQPSPQQVADSDASAEFMDRRLFTPHVLQHVENASKLKNLIDDFHGLRTPNNGYQEKLCKPYNGIDAANEKGCCPRECGKYCGQADCWKGVGGSPACCEGQMANFCSSHQNAPCWLNITKLALVFRDRQCKKYAGIEVPGMHGIGDVNGNVNPVRACCSPLCGEKCGMEDCADGPGGRTQCCASAMSATCGPGPPGLGRPAPCLLESPPSSFVYSRAHQSLFGGEWWAPEVGGGRPDSYSVYPALHKGLRLDISTGEIHGNDYVGDLQQYLVTARNSAGEVSTYFYTNKDAVLHHTRTTTSTTTTTTTTTT